MQTYKITKGNWIGYKNFASLQDADLYFSGVVESPYQLELAPENEQIPVIIKTEKQKLAERREFGEQLYEEFILDNAKIATDRGSVITRQEGKSLKSKVDDALEFVRAGSLELAKQELQELQADAILTQERIDKYVSMITTFLNNQ